MEPYLSALDRKSTRLNSSHVEISYAVFCLKKKRLNRPPHRRRPPGLPPRSRFSRTPARHLRHPPVCPPPRHSPQRHSLPLLLFFFKRRAPPRLPPLPPPRRFRL